MKYLTLKVKNLRRGELGNYDIIDDDDWSSWKALVFDKISTFIAKPTTGKDEIPSYTDEEVAHAIRKKNALRKKLINQYLTLRLLKANFHSVQNFARSIFSEHFLLKYVKSTTANEICSA